MSKKHELIVVEASKLKLLSKEEAALISKEIVNVREEVQDCPYLAEALKVLPVKGYRSAIGAYWNAVVDDIRQKIIHRSLDLFNKEVNPKKKIEKYEDFQDHITDNDLIEGAYKIGVLSWEARKLMHQARETRNMFHGHPKSSDPGLLKVLNLISDCNKYVLSEEFPPAIIDISMYLALMDSPDFSRSQVAVDQAFGDLPAVYKTELSNRFYTTCASESISSALRGNIEFCAPILWAALTKDDKKQIGKRLGNTVPVSFADVNVLRTDLQHDTDHGDKTKIKAKKKQAGSIFKKYSGETSPDLLDPTRFVLVQANLLSALELDLKNLALPKP